MRRMTHPAPRSRASTWLVTGGCGFIGSHFVRSSLRAEPGLRVVNLDKLNYAGSAGNLDDLAEHPRYRLVRGDIGDRACVQQLFDEHRPDAVVHLAAESHVDRSIDAPASFVETNIVGTFTLLEAARAYFAACPAERRDALRFVHVSTDEVYGSAAEDGPAFDETARYAPSSPYAASKASADHLVMAAHRTYGFPALVTHGCNTFGSHQFPEKFLPTVVLNALDGKDIPVYGDGRNERDWLAVSEHCDGLRAVLARGHIGQSYNIATGRRRSNLEMARRVCAVVDALVPAKAPSSRLLRFVTDRPGHDRRYAVTTDKIRRDTGWSAASEFDSALRDTVAWYIANRAWCQRIESKGYERKRQGLQGRAESSSEAP
ncbi:dTDP-glucose 4,6-dehydratase [Haliangium ochraceum]|uniref:dTDP-glucose 4,6-dehydratase n=1 Tax=Haliangium ochraceum (strain DSM 14365 / JCM 11303 / SMP-2) TaxID=502025 RepID=D0LP26_HALO1|nr:dTDP-glucose 4,6-dehydratase [Haliangium ochraceum DSM 14365]